MSKFGRRPMHFFGSWGVISILVGMVMTATIIWDKLSSIYITHVPVRREVTEQPVFYLALLAILIGTQLFFTGFLAELIARQSLSRRDYLVAERVNIPN